MPDFKFVNLTSHDLHIHDENGVPLQVIPESGQIARVNMKNEFVGEFGSIGVPCYVTEYGEVIGLPEPETGTLYITSAPVRFAVPERGDVASPGQRVRDRDDRIIGCRGLILNRK